MAINFLFRDLNIPNAPDHVHKNTSESFRSFSDKSRGLFQSSTNSLWESKRILVKHSVQTVSSIKYPVQIFFHYLLEKKKMSFLIGLFVLILLKSRTNEQIFKSFSKLMINFEKKLYSVINLLFCVDLFSKFFYSCWTRNVLRRSALSYLRALQPLFVISRRRFFFFLPCGSENCYPVISDYIKRP